MWRLKDLMKSASETTTEINGKWVPARPLNGLKGHCSFQKRLKDAWKVFQCRAEAFKWDENQ